MGPVSNFILKRIVDYAASRLGIKEPLNAAGFDIPKIVDAVTKEREDNTLENREPKIINKQRIRLPYFDKEVDYLIEMGRKSAGYGGSTTLLELRLTDSLMREHLEYNILHRLGDSPTLENANKWGALALLERYEFYDRPNEDFLERGVEIFKTKPELQEFVAVGLERKANVSLIKSTIEQMCWDDYYEAAERYKYYGNTHGYFNVLRRVALGELAAGHSNRAKDLLMESIFGFISEKYDPVEKIVREPGEQRWLCLADSIRALASVARMEGSYEDANELLWTAKSIYKSQPFGSGIASVYREKGLLERSVGNYHEGRCWLLSASRKFDKVGDEHHRSECLQAADSGFYIFN